jgi:putative SOS response-associated peptidase YedK
MCGRFAFYSPAEAVAALFGADPIPSGLTLGARYNIAPSEDIPAIRQKPGEEPELVLLRWGLVPFWAKDSSIGNRMINARAETIATKPAFRNAFRERRCLVLADGFYEWRTEPGGKTPYYISLANGQPFALAGLWEDWRDRQSGEVLETATIITTAAIPLLAELHHRMPVVLEPENARRWLAGDRELLDEITTGTNLPGNPELRAWPVTRKVNNARTEGPELIREAPAGTGR